jgi:monoamine oxidase
MGGLHALAVGLADGVRDAVHLEAPVRALTWGPQGVVASTARGEVVARHVVVALAPSQAAAITVSPDLPPARAGLHSAMPLGSVVKVTAVYERAFWRDLGLSGSVGDADGPFTYVADNSTPDSDLGVLVSFLSDSTARRLGDAALGPAAADARRSLWVEQAVRWFGPQATHLVHYVDRDWTAQPWIGGGYSGAMTLGGWTAYGPALRQPVGPLHWAGSETATEWTGYVEGALQSGERAAAEVVDALSGGAREPTGA